MIRRTAQAAAKNNRFTMTMEALAGRLDMMEMIMPITTELHP
jgi:hypothetical protein